MKKCWIILRMNTIHFFPWNITFFALLAECGFWNRLNSYRAAFEGQKNINSGLRPPSCITQWFPNKWKATSRDFPYPFAVISGSVIPYNTSSYLQNLEKFILILSLRQEAYSGHPEKIKSQTGEVDLTWLCGYLHFSNFSKFPVLFTQNLLGRQGHRCHM